MPMFDPLKISGTKFQNCCAYICALLGKLVHLANQNECIQNEIHVLCIKEPNISLYGNYCSKCATS